MTNNVSPFAFTSFQIIQSQITRKPLKKDDEFEVEIKPYGKVFQKRKEFQLVLEVRTFEKNGRFDAHVTAIGFFNFMDITDDGLIDNYFFTNAPAIIFPYIRSYISALTALSGMEPINLPPLNLGYLAPDLRKNTKWVK